MLGFAEKIKLKAQILRKNGKSFSISAKKFLPASSEKVGIFVSDPRNSSKNKESNWILHQNYLSDASLGFRII